MGLSARGSPAGDCRRSSAASCPHGVGRAQHAPGVPAPRKPRWPAGASDLARYPTLIVCLAASLAIGLASLGAPRTATASTWRDSAVVESPGARLFVDLRAADTTLPVLLILHGGPGAIQDLWSFMVYQ